MVKKLDGNRFDEHKASREEHKSMSLDLLGVPMNSPWLMVEKTRYTNPLKSKFRAKRLAAESWLYSFVIYIFHSRSSFAVDGGASAPAPKRPNVQMPDEYLPPNKILFLQNLPESVTKDQLMALFSQYVMLITHSYLSVHPHYSRYPNLHEVRLIPTKRDIAFVEFLDEGSAGVAKDALHNYKLDGENKIKVRVVMLYLKSMLIFLRRSRLPGSSRCMYI